MEGQGGPHQATFATGLKLVREEAVQVTGEVHPGGRESPAKGLRQEPGQLEGEGQRSRG